MDFDRLPSFLLSLCLHLGVAALILWWPASASAPLPPAGTRIEGYITLGAPGKKVPEARQAIPEAARGRPEPAPEVQKPPQPDSSKAVAQVQKPAETLPVARPEARPEVKPVEKPSPTPPEQQKPDAVPIPKEPETPREDPKPAPEPRPEPPKKEEPPKDEPKPEPQKQEPDQPKEPEKAKEPEKKPEKKTDPPKVDIDKELRDLARQTGTTQGTTTGSRRGSGADSRGSGSKRSGGSIDKELEALAKQIGGDGDDQSGTGPGGSGGDGLGALGDYLQVIQSRVKANWSFPGQADRRQFSTLVNIKIAADGRITQIRQLRSSGNAFYDSSVENALVRTARLEPPPRPDLMDIDIEFAF